MFLHKIIERTYAEKFMELSVDRFEKRPIATKNASGLFSYVIKAKDTILRILS